MKLILGKVLVAFSLMIVIFSCKKSSDAPACDVNNVNVSFDTIGRYATLSGLNTLFGAQGNNFSNTYVGTDQIRSYQWYFCGSTKNYIQASFRNDSIASFTKSFADNSCSGKVDSTTFNSLVPGLSYPDVQSIMMSPGDKYQVTFYRASSTVSTAYKFYDCANLKKYILATFVNDTLYTVRKIAF